MRNPARLKSSGKPVGVVSFNSGNVASTTSRNVAGLSSYRNKPFPCIVTEGHDENRISHDEGEKHTPVSIICCGVTLAH